MLAIPNAIPPPTAIVTPVIQLPALDDRKRHGPAMSIVSPIRFMGTARAVAAATLGSKMRALILVATGPGAMQFTVMFRGPSSRHRCVVSQCKPVVITIVAQRDALVSEIVRASSDGLRANQ